MSDYGIEPGDDGRCDIYRGIVKAVGQIPRAHATSHAHVDREGRVHSGIQWDHHVEREIWIAAPGEPDRRFILGEGFGVLPGHELVVACAPGCIAPFRAHNLSTGQLLDIFQPQPFSPGVFLLECAAKAFALAILPCPFFVLAWDDLRLALRDPGAWYYISEPSILPLFAAIFVVALALILLITTPFAGREEARRLRARRVVESRLAAFDADRGLGPRARIAMKRSADERSVPE